MAGALLPLLLYDDQRMLCVACDFFVIKLAVSNDNWHMVVVLTRTSHTY